jgi:hypothetical protein
MADNMIYLLQRPVAFHHPADIREELHEEEKRRSFGQPRLGYYCHWCLKHFMFKTGMF